MTENRLVQALCAEYLGMPVSAVESAAVKAPTSYKRYAVPKKNGKGWRIIYHPSRSTKALQHALVETLVYRMRVHDGAMAYRRGLQSPLKSNAARHARFGFSVRVDFRDFFPSIVPEDCYPLFEQDGVLGRRLRVAERDFVEKSAFVRVRGEARLAIGAPSSPALSNAVMYRFDRLFSSFAEGNDGVYTRYADDLVFSCDDTRNCGRFVRFVEKALAEASSPKLIVNAEKTLYMSRGTRRHVTGLILTPEGIVSLGRDRKRLLRSMVHRYALYANHKGKLTTEARMKLGGLLAFVLDVEPDFYNRLALKYGAKLVDAALHARRMP